MHNFLMPTQAKPRDAYVVSTEVMGIDYRVYANPTGLKILVP